MPSDLGDLIAETAQRIFVRKLDHATRLRAQNVALLDDVWNEVTAAGLELALAPESAGGSGLTPIDVMELIKAIGSNAAPVPLAETILAHWVIGRAGLKAPAGPISFASVQDAKSLRMERVSGGWHLRGRLARVPWGGISVQVAVVLVFDDKSYVALIEPGLCDVRPDINLAFEPRDELLVDIRLNEGAVHVSPVTPRGLHALGATVRSIAIAGAIERILSMTTAYALQRKQFGQPIGKFQAIRHYLAILAAQSSAANSAAEMACAACGDSIDPFAIGIAKARCSEAAGITAAIAHQVHGAIGMTEEYDLHFFTKRLWSWRDEFGNESEWNEYVGRTVAAAGAEGFWPLIATN